jgi:hypothetical protein
MAVSNASVPEDVAGAWYGLTPRHWRILWGAYLGWIFDGYEAVALVYALGPALKSILTPEQAKRPPSMREPPSALPCSAGDLEGCSAVLRPITSAASA